MLVSCLIPTYRQLDYLYETIDSVMMQDYEKIEIVIVDDCTDEFPDKEIENYIETIKGSNIISTKIIHNKINLGTVKNMNIGIKNCTGEIIMPLASDDVFFDEKVISKVVDRFKSKDVNVLVCTRMLYSKTLEDKIRPMPHPSYLKYISQQNTAELQFRAVAIGKSYEFASGAAMYYRRSFMKKEGLYDERYNLWEDGPFIARTVRNGEKIYSAFDIVSIKYRSGGVSGKKGKSIPKPIYEDYCRIFELEFLPFLNQFNMIGRRMIKGRYEYQRNYNLISMNLVVRYPDYLFMLFSSKIKRLCFRMLNKCKVV